MNRDKFNKWIGEKKPHRVEWVCMILAGVILGCFYLYNDILDTSSGGLRVWTALTEGRFAMFYEEAYVGAKGSALEYAIGGAYDFAVYLIFALYNLPLWIWEKVTGYSFTQFILTREFVKGIVWVFAAISAYFVYKIAKECDVDDTEAQWGGILFLTSGLFFFTEVMIHGYDIISVAFTLLGIYAYFKNNNKGFAAAFAVAIAMKMFALWIFIPLVLLKEKRIWRILVYGLEGISVIAIPKAYFMIASRSHMLNEAAEEAQRTGEAVDISGIGYASSEIIAAAQGIIDEALFPRDRMLQYTFVSLNAIPLVFIGMFAIWLLCYLNRKEWDNRKIIYLCAVVMGIFVLTVKMHPHWTIIAAPYLILVIVFHPERLRDNLVLEGAFAVGYAINKALAYPWESNLNLIENMFMPQHTFSYGSTEASGSDYGLSTLIQSLSDTIHITYTNIEYTFKALSVVGMVMFLIWNYPGRKPEEMVNTNTPAFNIQRRKWIYTRFVVSCCIGMLPMIGVLVYLS